MNIHAWHEETEWPLLEYRRMRDKYYREKAQFKKTIREKYGNDDCIPIGEFANLPRRVSKVSYSDSSINLHVYKYGGTYSIVNSRANLGTLDQFFFWIKHICRKKWATPDLVFDFIELVEFLYNPKEEIQ